MTTISLYSQRKALLDSRLDSFIKNPDQINLVRVVATHMLDTTMLLSLINEKHDPTATIREILSLVEPVFPKTEFSRHYMRVHAQVKLQLANSSTAVASKSLTHKAMVAMISQLRSAEMDLPQPHQDPLPPPEEEKPEPVYFFYFLSSFHSNCCLRYLDKGVMKRGFDVVSAHSRFVKRPLGTYGYIFSTKKLDEVDVDFALRFHRPDYELYSLVFFNQRQWIWRIPKLTFEDQITDFSPLPEGCSDDDFRSSRVQSLKGINKSPDRVQKGENPSNINV